MDLTDFFIPSPSSVDNISQELNMRNLQIVEEGPAVSQDITNVLNSEAGLQMSQELNMGNLQILEEGPRICPMCTQRVRLFFISFEERIEMCENVECVYPFAYEPLKIYREENGLQTVEIKSVMSKKASSTAYSQASTSAWSEVEKVCNESEIPKTVSDRIKSVAQLKKTESQRRKEELLRNVGKIKQMTKAMNEMKQRESKGIIKNEKWIKNLQYLQGMSGINLLKPEEMKQIKNKEYVTRSRELKINIDKNNLSNIRIEVNHATRPSTKRV